MRRTILCLLLLLLPAAMATAQQTDVARIEQMPRFPEPYAMRDWARVARGYDSLAFDLTRQGTHLPLVWLSASPVPSFGMPSYVGAADAQSREAINVLAALVGGTLVGADKRDQFGRDWVPMAEAFFNPDPSEGVYLNNPGGSSGSDWWYDTMPNVFFYQLFDLYRDAPPEAFDAQFRSVADRWLEAVRRMGGSATPWAVPQMDYRAWRLATMTGNASGVREPEAAGAIAWLLYHAYVETGEERYRMGAEWAMEFLDARTQNPSYELQLAYGAYVAARMNAELGTDYDVEQLVRWCFDVGPLRSWGAVTGTWGGYDVDGLIGEVNGSNDYAFAMNTFEQVGALVPLVRYDERYARAIGRWVLNAANAARLFYSAYLPDAHQDGEAWTHAYDPASVVAYEALRQTSGGRSPFATGDAVGGGWAATNLALYGSAHVGILGGIVDTTDVPYVLRLDARRTDYFARGRGYPTYLYYNPHDTEQTVTVDAGDAPVDLYDAVRDRVVVAGVQGAAAVVLPPDAAVLLVHVPAGLEATEQDGRLVAGGEVVDYRYGFARIRPPRVKGLAAEPAAVLRGGAATVYCTAEASPGETLRYDWTAEAGTIEGEGPVVRWEAPDAEGTYAIACTASDAWGGEARAELAVPVVASVPVVDAVETAPRMVDLGGTARLTCRGHDPASEDLTYTWEAAHGRVEGEGDAVDWIAPDAPGDYHVACRIANAAGADAVDSVRVAVRDFGAGDGRLVLYLPFDGAARDEGPEAHAVVEAGARPAPDPFGRPARAYHFDGNDDVVRVANAPTLSFGDGITLGFWLNVLAYYNREAYVASHGSWEQRWKLSISGERLRWTIHTDRGVYDLDAATRLDPRRFYHVVARYDGADVALYLNGALDALGAFSGTLQPSMHDLTIGQRLPGDVTYGMAGELDELRLFDGALSIDEVRALYDAAVAADAPAHPPAAATRLEPPFPNPSAGDVVLAYEVGAAEAVVVRVFNLLGQEVRTLVDADRAPGRYEARWDGTGVDGAPVAAGVYVCELTTGTARARRMLVRLR